MHIPIDLLRTVVADELSGLGVPPEQVEVGVEMCLDAELRGHRSHGLRLLRNVRAEYAWGAEHRRDLAVLSETAVSARIDGGFQLSWWVHRTAVDLLVEKASAIGIAVVSVSNAGVSGALGHLVERIAGAGLVGIAMNSSPVTVVAPGSAVPALGTNPLAIGLPRIGGDPTVLDMATSAIAFNQLMRLRDAGHPLPSGVASGPDGEITTDPNLALDPESGRGRILPFGGHRGYGLAVMLELMVSAGVTGRTAPEKREGAVLNPADFSGLYIAYRPDLVGDIDSASAATESLAADLDRVGARFPGQRSRGRRDEALRDGVVDIETESLAALTPASRSVIEAALSAD